MQKKLQAEKLTYDALKTKTSDSLLDKILGAARFFVQKAVSAKQTNFDDFFGFGSCVDHLIHTAINLVNGNLSRKDLSPIFAEYSASSHDIEALNLCLEDLFHLEEKDQQVKDQQERSTRTPKIK